MQTEQPRELQEHARAAPRRRQRAFPFRALEPEIEPPHLREADHPARGADRHDINESGAGGTLAHAALDQLLHADLGYRLVDTEP